VAEHELRWASLSTQNKNDQICELQNRDQIRELLNKERDYSAYALGQLEPQFFNQTRWFQLLNKADGNSGMVMHSKGGLGDATIVLGDPTAIAKILSSYPGAPITYISCQLKHLSAIEKTHHLSNKRPMLRLTVDRDGFKPDHGTKTKKLKGLNVHQINQLYGSEGRPTYYQSTHIDDGFYHGVITNGNLTAIAGTHITSKQEQIAVVGNVYTLPQYRGLGQATAATSATTKELLKFCTKVVLTVDPKNTPALAAYKHLGYREGDTFIESNARQHFGINLRSFGLRFKSKIINYIKN
jgi:GNAT superfamily N-acetyltransferase